MNLPQAILVFAIRFYRWVLSPAKSALFGPLGRCRFTPSCSEYALQAVCTHGASRGSVLAVRRLCRCHPWGGAGVDLVPPPTKVRQNARPEAKPFLSRTPAPAGPGH